MAGLTEKENARRRLAHLVEVVEEALMIADRSAGKYMDVVPPLRCGKNIPVNVELLAVTRPEWTVRVPDLSCGGGRGHDRRPCSTLERTDLDASVFAVREVTKPKFHAVSRRSSPNLLQLQSRRLDEPDCVHEKTRCSQEEALRLHRERSFGPD